MEALSRVSRQSMGKPTASSFVQQNIESIFELAVSPGVANKQFTPQQMITLAQVVGEKGNDGIYTES